MREVTATEAARHFSALLTAVERDGETFVVSRGGRVIARIESATGTSGKTVKALPRRHQPDPAWSDDLAAARELLTALERERPD